MSSSPTAVRSASAIVPHDPEPKKPELVLTEVRLINDKRFHRKCTIRVTINGEEQTRSFPLDIFGSEELTWKNQSRLIPADVSVIVEWASKRGNKSEEVTFTHDELKSAVQGEGGRECKRKAEGSVLTFIVKLKPLSSDPGKVDYVAKMDGTVKMAEGYKPVLDNLGKMALALKIVLKTSGVVKDVHPAVGAALGCVTAVFEALEKEQEVNERVRVLANDIARMAHLLAAAQSSVTLPEVSRVVDEIREVMDTATELVEKRKSRRGFYKAVDVLFSPDDPQVQELEQLLGKLIATFDTGIGIEALRSIKQLARSEKEDKLVQRINPGYKLPPERTLRCHSGTREDILLQIHQWTEDFDEPNVLWISAYPGTGKTTIASTAASVLKTEKRFGSFFSFNRTAEANPSTLWRMNCAKLADTYQPFLAFLFDKFKDFDFDNTTSDEVFDGLIYEPLQNWRMSLGSELVFRPPVIVVDALDECDSNERKSVLAAIEKWAKLPRPFKFIVTSRPEADIRRAFSTIPHRRVEIFTGASTSLKSREDIQTFLAFRFDEIRSEYESLSEGWVTKSDITDLTERAAGVFMWATTVTKYIAEEPGRLSQVLKGDLRDGKLFDLYQVLLDSSFPESTPEDIVETFHSVVGAIVVLQRPTTKADLCKLVGGVPATSVDRVLRGLASVLDNNGLLSFVHQSFIDFLTEHERVDIGNNRRKRTRIECPERFRICMRDANQMIFKRIFSYMIERLEFNICRIPTSFELNSPSSRARVDDTVEGLLRYACQFWGFHLSAWLSKPFPEQKTIISVQVPLADFMKKKLLFWLEALSGTGAYHAAFPALLQLRDCIQEGYMKDLQSEADDLDEIMALISDSLQFCRYFGPVLSSSVPHIYLSALPFAPTSSLVASTYGRLYADCLKLIRGQISQWPALQIAIKNRSAVYSIAFSPDGKRIASGSDDKTIRIWDAETGQAIAEPFRGHEDSVNSVAFSPDGKRIASGSRDKTIRIWDTESGQAIAEPFFGHEDWILSVAFSPDGQRLASGSRDKTIRVWDVETGQAVAEPLRGHEGSVTSVAFSPDGKRIASGSSDTTIRIWDAETGQTVTDPSRGHEHPVNSVAFSPDGKRIASGANDNTTRMWDAEMGQAIGEPLRSHDDWVRSATFSPDGKRIASGSDDKTIRMWDAETGQPVGNPFRGHGSWVLSVAFSPDGKRVASSSDDNTIRLWDAETGQAVGKPFRGHAEWVRSRGHEEWVRSVAFSPDGKRIASGSKDMAIRIWDAETGQAVGDSFRGHGSWVNSVAFSPDGKYIASGSSDSTIRLWDVETGQAIVEPFRGHEEWVRSVAFSSSGKYVASGSDDKTVRLWDAETGQAIAEPLLGHEGYIFSVAFSPDGKRVASGSKDKTIRVWDAKTGKPAGGSLRGHEDSVSSVAFSPDGKHIASGSADSTIRLWDVETEQAIAELFHGHGVAYIFSVAFSPDGKCIASGAGDNTIRIWDSETGQTVGEPLYGHEGSVLSVAFSPDGKRIASGSKDMAIRIWEKSAIGMTNSTYPQQLETQDSTAAETAATSIAHSSHFLPGFSAHSAIDDGGWVLGDDGKPLFWVPPLQRAGLYRPGNTVLIGPNAVQLDFTNAVWGESWTDCYTGS